MMSEYMCSKIVHYSIFIDEMVRRVCISIPDTCVYKFMFTHRSYTYIIIILRQRLLGRVNKQ